MLPDLIGRYRVLVECNHCGAPLDVRENVRFTKCRYCGTTDERTKLKTVAVVTPPTFQPPTRWTPPASVPADSSVELAYRPPSGARPLVVLVLALIVLVGVAAFVAFGKSTGGIAGRPGGDVLAKLSLGTPTAVASSLSTKASETSVYAPLDSPRFEYLTFGWKEGHLDHPQYFYFSARKNARIDDSVRAALAQKLGRPLDENGAWRWEHVWMNFDAKTGSISGNVDVELSDNEPNPYWKRQLEALFRIVVSVTFNQNVGPTQAEAQELLGTGYPFGTLNKLDPKTPVEAARDRVTKLFPGAVVSTRSGISAHVAVDHPLFAFAELEWKNEKAAALSQFGLRPRPGPGSYNERRDALATCLTKTLGKPEITETDYLKKKKDYQFVLAKTRVYVSESYLYCIADVPMEPAQWTRILSALEACR